MLAADLLTAISIMRYEKFGQLMDQYSTEAQEEKLADLRARMRRQRLAQVSRIACSLLAGAAVGVGIYYRTAIGEWSYQMVGKPAAAETASATTRPDVKQQLKEIKEKSELREKALDDLMK
jgi:hypothetical protein